MSDRPASATTFSDTRRIAWALAVYVLLLSSLEVAASYRSYTWLHRDSQFYANTNVTIVERFTLEQHPFAESWYQDDLGWNRDLTIDWSNVSLGRHGEFWPKHPYLMPVLSTPFFWAFGLPGTMLFNVLAFGGLAAFAWILARAYASPTSSAIAVATFLFATTLHENIAGYHVDILVTACVVATSACLVRRAGFSAGVLFGLALGLKPTCLMFVPFLLLLAWEHASWRTIGRGMLGGLVVLLPMAAANTYMFGRPWWTGYARVLVETNGVRLVATHVDSFTREWKTGLKDIWSGDNALSKRHTIMALAAPGFFVMLVRRPRYALGALISIAASLYVFSRYVYEGERFQWPAIALLVVPLAVTLDSAARVARSGVALFSRGVVRRAMTGPFAAALVTFAIPCTLLPFDPPVAARVGHSPYVIAASTLAEHYTFTLAPPDAQAPGTKPELSPVAQDRFGHTIERTPLLASVVAAPLYRLAKEKALFWFHLLCAAIVAFCLARFLAGLAHPTIASAAAIMPFALAPVRELVASGGPVLLAATATALALDSALGRRYARAAFFAVLAAWFCEAPWLVAVAVLVYASRDGLRGIGLALLGAVPVLSLWGAATFLFLGHPFASVDDCALVAAPHGTAIAPVVHQSLTDLLHGALEDTSWRRAWLVALWLSVAGVLVALVRRPRQGFTLATFVGSLLFSRIAEPLPTVLGTIALLVPLTALVDPVSALLATLRGSRIVAAIGALAGLLLVLGTIRRHEECTAPWHLAGRQAIREAHVEMLGAQTIPCDLFIWQRYSWECSHFDQGGAHGMVGLGIDEDGVRVDGDLRPMLILSTGWDGRPRRITWDEHLVQGRQLALYFAPIDGEPADGTLTVHIGNVTRTLELGGRGIHGVAIDTHAMLGRRVPLSLEIAGRHSFSRTVVALDGRFR